MPRNQRAIIKLNPGDRVEITLQGELEIMILGNKSQRRRRNRRGRRTQQKQNHSFSCQKHEKLQTPEPQSQQQAQSSENQSQVVPTQARLPRSQPEQPQFETQQWLPHWWTQPAEGLKQRDIDEATRQRSEYRERLQRILDVAQVKSSQSEPKKSKYVPAQYQREGTNWPEGEKRQQKKPQTLAGHPSRGQSHPQSKPQNQPGDDRPQSQPQSRQKQQRPYTEPVEKQVDKATRRLSQQGFRSQQLMNVPQSHSASGQPLQQLSHAHPEPQMYVPAQYQKPDARPQKPPQPSQVQSREPFLFQQSVNAHPQSQPRKMQEKQQQQPS
ncbi:uncharacterized protein ASPGLDRAFT_85950, partial [Aspergillus glaucus CBS 516.65]